jgi:hypothetical protein
MYKIESSKKAWARIKFVVRTLASVKEFFGLRRDNFGLFFDDCLCLTTPTIIYSRNNHHLLYSFECSIYMCFFQITCAMLFVIAHKPLALEHFGKTPNLNLR